MLRSPLGKWLWDARRALLAWTVAIVGVGVMYAAFWPSIDNPDMQAALDSYPDAVLEAMNFTQLTAAGYVNATVYGLVVGVLTIVYSVAAGARMVAGDEEAGTLDLVLAHPVSRRRLALERFAGFLVATAGVVAVLLLAMLALSGPAGLDEIGPAGFAAMSLHLLLFAVFFGSLSFAAGAVSGRRSVAIGVGALVAVLGFAANGVLPQVEGLEWAQDLSPFDWLGGGEPLVNGVQAVDVLVMAGLGVALVGVGTAAFDRRDLAV